jgi:hypothetical protein
LIVAVLLTPQFPLFFVGKLPQHTSRRIAGKLSFKEEKRISDTTIIVKTMKPIRLTTRVTILAPLGLIPGFLRAGKGWLKGHSLS